jgi:hypothetical protein
MVASTYAYIYTGGVLLHIILYELHCLTLNTPPGARRTPKTRIGQREPYFDFKMQPPPHHFKEHN